MENLIPLAPLDLSRGAEFEQKSTQALQRASRFIIEDAAQAADAATFLSDLKIRLEALEAARKEITRPLDDSKKAVMDMFRKPVEAFTAARDMIRKAIADFQIAQDLVRAEAERQAREKAAEIAKRADAAKASGRLEQAEFLQDRAAAVVEKAIEAPKEKIAGVSFREKWTAVVVNVGLLPRAYLVPDQSALDELARKTKGTAKIEGVNFKCEKIPVQRG
jgi:hypothetical protein